MPSPVTPMPTEGNRVRLINLNRPLAIATHPSDIRTGVVAMSVIVLQENATHVIVKPIKLWFDDRNGKDRVALSVQGDIPVLTCRNT